MTGAQIIVVISIILIHIVWFEIRSLSFNLGSLCSPKPKTIVIIDVIIEGGFYSV
jgi:hypothetical protein